MSRCRYPTAGVLFSHFSTGIFSYDDCFYKSFSESSPGLSYTFHVSGGRLCHHIRRCGVLPADRFNGSPVLPFLCSRVRFGTFRRIVCEAGTNVRQLQRNKSYGTFAKKRFSKIRHLRISESILHKPKPVIRTCDPAFDAVHGTFRPVSNGRLGQVIGGQSSTGSSFSIRLNDLR